MMYSVIKMGRKAQGIFCGCEEIKIMNFKIVADSSADVLSLSGVEYASVPLSITVAGKEYVDDDSLNLEEMLAELSACKEKTSTACPGTARWLSAFGEADHVICFTITSGLSGTFNAASLAAREYEENHPGRKVHVVDTLSTGPEMELLIEKTAELYRAGLEYDEIIRRIESYRKHTYLLFSLKSLHNFVINGRISPAVGALVGLLGIRIVGRASEEGTLQPVAKCRGDKKALQAIISNMKELGFKGGLVRIHHCCNEALANALREGILSLFPGVDIRTGLARGLCSYYAEEGGVLIGFEGA